jgi:AcrR family transcriptional regulator
MSAQPARNALETSRQADRPRGHAGATDPEKAIFAALGRLLDSVPLHDISVGQIIAEAGISRATFYFYFSSKFAVVSGLLAVVRDELAQAMEPFITRVPSDPPQAAIRRTLEGAGAVWTEHRPVLRAVAENWHAVPELRAAWLDTVAHFKAAITNEIDAGRAAGHIPPGPDSRQLTALLLWSTERSLYIAGLGADADLPDERITVELLIPLWVGAIYGGGTTAARPDLAA